MSVGKTSAIDAETQRILRAAVDGKLRKLENGRWSIDFQPAPERGARQRAFARLWLRPPRRGSSAVVTGPGRLELMRLEGADRTRPAG